MDSFEGPGILVELPKKSRGERRSYTLTETFESKSEAEEFIKKESCWSSTKLVNTTDGDRRYYRCNKVKARGLQCATSIYLQFDCAGAKVLLFRCQKPHNCDLIDNKSGTKLTVDVKLLIEQMCDKKKTPLAIMDHIALQKLPLPKMYLINNHIAKYKREKFGNATISIAELSELLEVMISTSDFS